MNIVTSKTAYVICWCSLSSQQILNSPLQTIEYLTYNLIKILLFIIYKLIFTFFRVKLYSYTIFHSGNCVRNISLAFMREWNALVPKCFFLGITTIWNFCRGHRIFRVAADSKTLNHSTSVESFWCWFPDHHAQCWFKWTLTFKWCADMYVDNWNHSHPYIVFYQRSILQRNWCLRIVDFPAMKLQYKYYACHMFFTPCFALVASYLHASLTHHAPWNKWAFS